MLQGLLHLLTVGLFTFYLVAEGPKLRRNVCSLLSEERQRQVLFVWDLAVSKTGGYIYSRLILAVVSFLVHWLVFWLVGAPFPVPMAMWVGLVSQFVPVIGTYIAGALPVLIGLLDKPSTGLAILIAIVVYQQVENYLLQPKVTAHTMEIHVTVAFGSVIAGGLLLGGGGRGTSPARGGHDPSVLVQLPRAERSGARASRRRSRPAPGSRSHRAADSRGLPPAGLSLRR